MTDPREMQAGVELDRCLAIEVMGYKRMRMEYIGQTLMPETFTDQWLSPQEIENFRAGKDWEILGPSDSQEIGTGGHWPPFSSDPSASAELKAKLWGMGMSEIQILIFSNRIAVRIFHRSYSTDWIEVEIKGDLRPAECEAVGRAGLIAARARKAGAA